MTYMLWLQSIFGLLVLLGVAYFLSEKPKAIQYRPILIALLIHIVLAVMLLKIPLFQNAFLMLNNVVLVLDHASTAGTSFVFGYLGGGDAPFSEIKPQHSFILAFKALPIILFISALSALLYHLRILPFIVKVMSFFLQKTIGVSGSVGLGVSANAFVGMVEAPLLIKPYLTQRTRGELFAIMVAGMATIAGTVLVLYANILSDKVDNSLGHILSASILNLFSALAISLFMVPHETDNQNEQVDLPPMAVSVMDAIVQGTMDGIKLLVSIVALLFVLVALVELINQILTLFPPVFGQPLTLQTIFGWLAAPLTFCLGIPLDEVFTAGALMGTKIVLNELIAYLNLLQLPTGALQERSQIIMLYALCGFANIGSLGIMLGGLTAMAPQRRDDIISLGWKSVLAGVLATSVTACIVGMVLLV